MSNQVASRTFENLEDPRCGICTGADCQAALQPGSWYFSKVRFLKSVTHCWDLSWIASFSYIYLFCRKNHCEADCEKELPCCMRAPNILYIGLFCRSLFIYICLVCRKITVKQTVEKNYLVACEHPISYVYVSYGGLLSYIYASFAGKITAKQTVEKNYLVACGHPI